MFASGHNAEVVAIVAPRMTESSRQNDEIMRSLEATLQAPEAQALIARLAGHRATLREARRAGAAATTAGDAAALEQARAQVVSSTEALIAGQQELTQIFTQQVEAKMNEAYATISSPVALALDLAKLLLVLVLGVFFAVSITRSIRRPVQEAVQTAVAISRGDLTHR